MADNSMDQFSALIGRTFVWHELYVPDVDKARDFYRDALDMDSKAMDMGAMGSYTMLAREGNGVCGIVGTNNPQMQGVPPHWAVYLSVDDVDARVAKSLELGATLVVPAMDIPTVGRMAQIADPQGAHIWLFKPAPMPDAA